MKFIIALSFLVLSSSSFASKKEIRESIRLLEDHKQSLSSRDQVQTVSVVIDKLSASLRKLPAQTIIEGYGFAGTENSWPTTGEACENKSSSEYRRAKSKAKSSALAACIDSYTHCEEDESRELVIFFENYIHGKGSCKVQVYYNASGLKS